MSELGFRSVDEMVGRSDVLTVSPKRFFQSPLVLERMLTPADKLPDAGIFGPVENRRLYPQDHSSVLPPGGTCANLIKLSPRPWRLGSQSRRSSTSATLTAQWAQDSRA